MMGLNTLAAGMLALAQLMPGSVSAAPVTLIGNTVNFTFDDAMLGRFGPASLAGDTIYFTPTAFRAQSLNGAGFSLASETMNVRLTARDGYAFGSASLLERGDYLLLGAGGLAEAGGQLRIFDAAAPQLDVTSVIGSPVPLATPGLPTRNWTAHSFADLSGFSNGELNLTIQNLLIAATFDPASLAFVEKKFAGLTVGTVALAPVPEAETYAMLLAGLGLVAVAARRRRPAPE